MVQPTSPIDKGKGSSETPKFPEYNKYKALLENALKAAEDINKDFSIKDEEKLEVFNDRFTKIEPGAILETYIPFQQHVENIRKLLDKLNTIKDEKKNEFSTYLKSNVNLGGCLEGRMDPVWDYFAIPTLIDRNQPMVTNITRVFKSVCDGLLRVFERTYLNDPIALVLIAKNFGAKENILQSALSMKSFSDYVHMLNIQKESLESFFDDYMQDYIEEKINGLNPLAGSIIKPEQAVHVVASWLSEMKPGQHVLAKMKLFEILENRTENNLLISKEGDEILYEDVTHFFGNIVKSDNYPENSRVVTALNINGRIKSSPPNASYVILENDVYVNKNHIKGVIHLI